MAAILAKLGSWVVGTLFPMLLNFLWGKWQGEQKEREEKKKDDKKVDDATEKAKDPDLGKRLDGTKDLEDGINDHA